MRVAGSGSVGDVQAMSGRLRTKSCSLFMDHEEGIDPTKAAVTYGLGFAGRCWVLSFEFGSQRRRVGGYS